MEQINGQVVEELYRQRLKNFVHLTSAIGGGLFLLVQNVQTDLRHDPKKKLFIFVCKAMINGPELDKPLQLTFNRHYAENRMDEVSEQFVYDETDGIRAKLLEVLSKK